MYIKNRHHLRIFLKVQRANDTTKLVFVTHGLSGSSEQPHIVALAELFVNNGYTVVTFDTTHSLNESDGDLRHITATSCIEDLEDVIEWASTQSWYSKSFTLAGHSLGGLASIMYASKFPGKVAELYLVSPAISGQWWLDTLETELTVQWKQDGEIHKTTRMGRSGYIGWDFVEDFITYDARAQSSRISASTILTVGSMDDTTPPDMIRSFYDRLACTKKIFIVNDISHSPHEALDIDALHAPIRRHLASESRKG